MFYGANAFKHQLGSWNASKAKRQQSMLEHAIAFNQSGLNSTTTGSFNGAIEIEPQQCRWAFVAGVFCAVAVYLCVLRRFHVSLREDKGFKPSATATPLMCIQPWPSVLVYQAPWAVG